MMVKPRDWVLQRGGRRGGGVRAGVGAPSAVDAGVVDTGAAEAGAVETGVIDTGAVKAGSVGDGQFIGTRRVLPDVCRARLAPVDERRLTSAS